MIQNNRNVLIIIGTLLVSFLFVSFVLPYLLRDRTPDEEMTAIFEEFYISKISQLYFAEKNYLKKYGRYGSLDELIQDGQIEPGYDELFHQHELIFKVFDDNYEVALKSRHPTFKSYIIRQSGRIWSCRVDSNGRVIEEQFISQLQSDQGHD